MPLHLHISHFRAVRRATIETDSGRMSLLLGDNESGKTSILHAIRFALGGQLDGIEGSPRLRFSNRGQGGGYFSVGISLRGLAYRCEPNYGPHEDPRMVEDNAKSLGVDPDLLKILCCQEGFLDQAASWLRLRYERRMHQPVDWAVALAGNDAEILSRIPHQEGTPTLSEVITESAAQRRRYKPAGRRWRDWHRVFESAQRIRQQRHSEIEQELLPCFVPFSKQVLGGRHLVLSEDGQLLFHHRPISTAGRSLHWLISLAIRCALTRFSGFPLILIDNTDLLDPSTFTRMVQFVDREMAPHVDHVLMTANRSYLVQSLTSGFHFPGECYLMDRGVLQRLES